MKKLTPILIIIIFFAAGYFIVNFVERSLNPSNIQSVTVNNVKVKVEVALTPAKQELGLGGRESLAENSGMLFVFNQPGKNYFWMKDMQFPIDMIWIGEDMHVLYIEKNVSPDSYPQTFGPDENSKYVLEVNAGFADKNNIIEGEAATLNY